jgi:hypothetical protein
MDVRDGASARGAVGVSSPARAEVVIDEFATTLRDLLR